MTNGEIKEVSKTPFFFCERVSLNLGSKVDLPNLVKAILTKLY